MNKCEILGFHELLGKKWVFGLIHNISTTPTSYSQLYALTNKKINQTLFSNRLQELCQYNIIKKDETNKYSLTFHGIRIKNALHEIKKILEDANLKQPIQCKGKTCTGCPSFNCKNKTISLT